MTAAPAAPSGALLNPAIPNPARCERLARAAAAALELDLSGLTVLTEAATGPFCLTAPLAALAGATRVIALTRDSRFGSAAEARRQTLAMAERWGVADRIAVIADRSDPAVSTADVVTNLGFVRPLDAAFLARLKPTAAIALMFETWEFRPQDVDLAECRRRGLPVLGTDETHPALGIFRYLTPVALRLLLDGGVEATGSRVVLAADDGAQRGFGDALADGLAAAGASVTRIATTSGDFASDDFANALRAAIPTADALLFADHRHRGQLCGPAGPIDGATLARLNPGLLVCHMAGGVDRDDLVQHGLDCRPDWFAPPGAMSVTTAHAGPRPVIDLHAGGLLVGALLARARLAGLSAPEAAARALAHPICQDFPADFAPEGR